MGNETNAKKGVKNHVFFYNMYLKNWKSTDLVTGHICFYWKKTLKKTCFFHVFLHCFFAFCLDLRWTRTFWTGFRMLSWLLDLSMYDRSNHAEATISTLSFQKLQTFLEFWTYCATFFSSKCHFEPQSLIYHNKWLSWAFLAPEDDFYLFLNNFW